MSFHRVSYEELEDYSFEKILCSSYPKKLLVHVKPSSNYVCFNYYYKQDLVFSSYELSDALEEYNKGSQ